MNKIQMRSKHLAQRIKEQNKDSNNNGFPYQEFFNAIPESIMIHDFNGNIIDVNTVACHTFGYSREEMVHMHLFQLLIPENHIGFKECIRDLKTTGKFLGNAEAIHKSGSSLTIHIQAVVINIENKDFILSSVRPLSHNGNISGFSNKKEDQYKYIVENSAEVIVILQDGHIIFHNQLLCELTGFSPDEIKNMPFIEQIHPEDRGKILRDHMDRLSGKAVPSEGDFRVFHKEGREMWVDRYAVLIDWEQKPAVLAMFHDITDRKNQEMERENLIQELESKNAELEQFTYTVSHDLKSPLITIKGFIGALQKDMQDANQRNIDRDIFHITNAVDKMSDLLHDLLGLSRIGRIVNPPAMVELKDIVNDVVFQFQERLEDLGITLEVSKDLPAVFCDSKRIHEIFLNLLENAIKFCKDQPSPKVKIDVQEESGQQIIFVEDNGLGIDPQYHTKVFGLFEQLNPEKGGTGIGLAIVKRIIEVHGGEIWVESDGVGKGSRFCFTLPSQANSNVISMKNQFRKHKGILN